MDVIPGKERTTEEVNALAQPAADATDWPAKASATVVHYVGMVREKTTGPALAASRTAVYSLAMALIGLVLFILVLIGLIRLLVIATGYLPFVEPGETWLTYYVLGGIFVITGAVLWRKKEPR